MGEWDELTQADKLLRIATEIGISLSDIPQKMRGYWFTIAYCGSGAEALKFAQDYPAAQDERAFALSTYDRALIVRKT